MYPNTYGHGHLIEQGSASRGYRTILAYTTTNHSTRVNYYSNPGVIYSNTGTYIRTQAISNNAAVLLENRFKMAAISDESDACKVSTAPSPTPPPPPQPQGFYGGGCESMLGTCNEGACIFPFVFKGQAINSCTNIDGDSQAWSATEVTLNQTQKKTKSLHNLHLIYSHSTSVFLAFTKDIRGNLKKITPI
jgi:hypothetical protein